MLRRHGVTPDEYRLAFPAAIERLRGRWAASNAGRRSFVEAIIGRLETARLIRGFDKPRYGEDTVYRLTLLDGAQVGIIQKGCPDGRHSSEAWSRPEWASELYLWWLCSSTGNQPGEHVWKGVGRVRRKIAEEPNNQLDGLIFFNEQCGTPERPCPKLAQHSIELEGRRIPPPCVYVLPHWNAAASEANWRGEQARRFPATILALFGLPPGSAGDFTGFVGFKRNATGWRTEVTNRFGAARATTARD